jgi:glutaredoxin
VLLFCSSCPHCSICFLKSRSNIFIYYLVIKQRRRRENLGEMFQMSALVQRESFTSPVIYIKNVGIVRGRGGDSGQPSDLVGTLSSMGSTLSAIEESPALSHCTEL